MALPRGVTFFDRQETFEWGSGNRRPLPAGNLNGRAYSILFTVSEYTKVALKPTYHREKNGIHSSAVLCGSVAVEGRRLFYLVG